MAALLVLAALTSSWLTVLLLLVIALQVLIAGMGVELNAAALVFVLGYSLSYVIIAAISAGVLDRFAFSGRHKRILSVFAVTLSLYFTFESMVVLELLESAVTIAAAGAVQAAELVALVNTILYCSAAISLSFMFLILVVELPLSWFLSQGKVKHMDTLNGIRPLFVILIFSFSSYLIVDFVRYSIVRING